MSSIAAAAIVASFIDSVTDITISAVCLCGRPIVRGDLRIENFGTDDEPSFKPVACCSHDDYDAKSPDDINLDRVWAWHVKQGVYNAKEELNAQIRNMRNALGEAIKEFLDSNA